MQVYENKVEYGQPVAAGDRHWVHVEGTVAEAAEVAAILVRMGVEFTFDPYPDDEWEFTVKADQRQQLINAVNVVTLTTVEAKRHPAVQLVGGRVPEHVPGAYPNLPCCGGPVAGQGSRLAVR